MHYSLEHLSECPRISCFAMIRKITKPSWIRPFIQICAKTLMGLSGPVCHPSTVSGHLFSSYCAVLLTNKPTTRWKDKNTIKALLKDNYRLNYKISENLLIVVNIRSNKHETGLRHSMKIVQTSETGDRKCVNKWDKLTAKRPCVYI